MVTPIQAVRTDPSEDVLPGNPDNWPNADGINTLIQRAESSNGTISPISGMGNRFIEYGTDYGINPGVVAAILQRESQMGADGSVLPTRCNNFGGIVAGGPLSSGSCGAASGIAGRDWSQFRSPADGIKAEFALLDQSLYRNTGGRLADVIEKYSPAFENDHASIFRTFAAAGSVMGITIDRDTNIYRGNPSTTRGTSESGGDSSGIGGFVNTLRAIVTGVAVRGFFILIGLVLIGFGIRAVLKR